jgi:hypothetical protein
MDQKRLYGADIDKQPFIYIENKIVINNHIVVKMKNLVFIIKPIDVNFIHHLSSYSKTRVFVSLTVNDTVYFVSGMTDKILN